MDWGPGFGSCVILGDRSGAPDLTRENIPDERLRLFRGRGSDLAAKRGAEGLILAVGLLATTNLGVAAHHHPISVLIQRVGLEQTLETFGRQFEFSRRRVQLAQLNQ